MLTHVDQILIFAAGTAYRHAETSFLEQVVQQQSDMYALAPHIFCNEKGGCQGLGARPI